MKGSCACGAVTVTVSRAPEYVNFCDCSLCRRVGAAWGYYLAGDIRVEGPTAGFVRDDLEAHLTVHFCPRCSCVTHWSALDPAVERVGVNVRLFPEDDLAGVEARFPDGRNWTGEVHPGYRRSRTRIGDEALP